MRERWGSEEPEPLAGRVAQKDSEVAAMKEALLPKEPAQGLQGLASSSSSALAGGATIPSAQLPSPPAGVSTAPAAPMVIPSAVCRAKLKPAVRAVRQMSHVDLPRSPKQMSHVDVPRSPLVRSGGSRSEPKLVHHSVSVTHTYNFVTLSK